MKKIDYYMNFNYDIKIHKYSDKEGGGYRVSIPQLGDAAFVADGDSVEDAIINLNIVKKEIFNYYIKNKIKIEKPKEISEEDRDFSGKFIIRVPIELHKKLSTESKAQNISLNSYINYLLTSNLTLDSVCNKIKAQIISSYNESLKFDYNEGEQGIPNNLYKYSKKYNKVS